MSLERSMIEQAEHTAQWWQSLSEQERDAVRQYADHQFRVARIAGKLARKANWPVNPVNPVKPDRT